MKHLLLLLLILGCSSTSQKNHRPDNSFDPFSILSLESNLVEVKYVVTGYTQSIPPYQFKREDSYIFDIIFILSFSQDNKIWDKPIYVLYEPIESDVEIINYEKELNQSSGNIFPEYVGQIEVKKRGKIRVLLGYEDESGNLIFDRSNPFRTKEITLN